MLKCIILKFLWFFYFFLGVVIVKFDMLFFKYIIKINGCDNGDLFFFFKDFVMVWIDWFDLDFLVIVFYLDMILIDYF